jgi:hypothetical protein
LITLLTLRTVRTRSAARAALALLRFSLGTALLVVGCGRSAAPPGPAGQYDYAIAPPAEGSWVLGVEVTLDRAPSDRFVAPSAPEAFRDVSVASGSSWAPAPHDGDGWSAPACHSHCVLRYAVDLEALAAGCRRMDCSRRVGDAVIGVASSWMLRADPVGDALVHVHVHGGSPERFATGLRRDPRGGYMFDARDLGEAAYTAFGSFRTAHAQLSGARFDVELLGPQLRMGDSAAVDWVKGAAACVSGLFGRFPVDATVFVVPVSGAHEVVFGRVMSLGGASVVLLFGDEARPSEMHDDWVVVHELFHLGCPSFVGEGHWLEEGLATYYEPVLRERAGWMSEADLWLHFFQELPRGLRREGEPASIEERDDIDSTYWGGALFVFVADLELRAGTGNARSMDDVVRTILAVYGDATRRARLADFLRTGDETTGAHVLANLYDRWAVHGQNVDLEGLWQRMGVAVRDGHVVLDDGAPLASVRKAIAAGIGH